ncbi:MAG: DUF929 domain-containing protein [Chloroflexota bacterium]|nr:DUF929 domain-containing protein [Chloroflexota bacterium]
MTKAKHKPAQTQHKSGQSIPSTPHKPVQAAETVPSKQEQRGQRPEASRAAARAQTQTRAPRYQRRKSSRGPWLLVGGIVIAIAVIVGIFVLISHQGSSGGSAKPTSASVLNEVNKIDPSVFEVVDTGGLKSPITAAPGGPTKLLGPTGKPEFFYEGAEYCPYCAAQRWSVATALARFGKFTKLSETTSSSSDAYPNTATLSFYGSAYSSPYIDFVSVEETTNQSDGKGGYVTLQTPTADELQIITKYNSSGSIPFISVANQYLVQTPAFTPDVLTGLSQQDIASKFADPNSTVAKNVLGGANYLTASICAVTNNQPTSVCTQGAIPQIEQALPKVQGTVQNAGSQLGALVGSPVIATRRED